MYLKTSAVCLFHHVSQHLLPGTSHTRGRQQDLLNKPKDLIHEPVSEKWECGWLFKKVCRNRVWQWEVTSKWYYLQGALKEEMRKVKQTSLNFLFKKIWQYGFMMLAMETWRQIDTWSLLASEPNLLGEHQFPVRKTVSKDNMDDAWGMTLKGWLCSVRKHIHIRGWTLWTHILKYFF